MTSDICSNELCECGHLENEHQLRVYNGERHYCYKCECKRFTPSPKSNSHPEEILGKLELSNPKHQDKENCLEGETSKHNFVSDGLEGNRKEIKQSLSSGSDNIHTLAEIEQRIRKGCKKEVLDGIQSDADGEYYDVCGFTECNEMDGTKHKFLCPSCQAQLSLCKEFRDMIERLKDEVSCSDINGSIFVLNKIKEIVGSSNG